MQGATFLIRCVCVTQFLEDHGNQWETPFCDFSQVVFQSDKLFPEAFILPESIGKAPKLVRRIFHHVLTRNAEWGFHSYLQPNQEIWSWQFHFARDASENKLKVGEVVSIRLRL